VFTGYLEYLFCSFSIVSKLLLPYYCYVTGKLSYRFFDGKFRQDNQSLSNYGVIRGLHFQQNPHSQTKLIRILEGVIYDVVLDLRKGSPTFGKWFGMELSDENKRQLYIPKGFAHGLSVLSEQSIILYKCDNFYHPQSEGGVLYNDPALGIDWKVDAASVTVSDKDKVLPTFGEVETNFVYAS